MATTAAEWKQCMIETCKLLGVTVSPDATDVSIAASLVLAIDGRDKERKTLRATLKMIRDMRQNHSDYKIAQLATKLATEALAKTASRE